jgi:hypothetical protein
MFTKYYLLLYFYIVKLPYRQCICRHISYFYSYTRIRTLTKLTKTPSPDANTIILLPSLVYVIIDELKKLFKVNNVLAIFSL